MDRKMFGRRINAARKDIGLTSEQLAEQCNINPTFLRQIESGIKLPSLPVFLSICNALNVSSDYLLCDALVMPENTDLGKLSKLVRTASPRQIELISKMINAALEYCEK